MQADVSAFLSSLETSLDKAYAANPNPGHATLHRLNRTEYANSIRDLLALDVDASTLLPPDDESYGFDNNADVLGVSPVLLERYVSASRKVSRLAVGDPTQDAVAQTFRTRPDLSQDKRVEGLAAGNARRFADALQLPAGWQVRHQGRSGAQHRGRDSRPGRSASDRNFGGWRARVSGHRWAAPPIPKRW